MEAKNRKLRSQFEAEASSSSLFYGETTPSSVDGKGIFNGVSIFVDGHTVPSSQELKGYMLRHGGRFENYFSRSRVTHIICSNLPNSKMKNLRAFSRGLPVLKPAWVVDSVAANKLLNWPPYLLTEQSSEMYKQQKLSIFFGCKRISSLKDAEVTLDSNDGTDPEGLEKSKDLTLPLESKGTKVEGDSSLMQISIQPNCHADEGSGEPTNAKWQQTFDVHHSTFTDPNFVENYFKVLRGKTLESEATKNSCSTSQEQNQLEKVEPPGFCYSKSNILQTKSTTCAMDLASGSSSKAFSSLQNFCYEANLDKFDPAHVLNHSASVASDYCRNIPNHIEPEKSKKSKIDLWSGSPPKWVEKFEDSNYLILNLTAQLYTKYGTEGLLSPILQLLISLNPLILGSNSEEPLEAHFDLCELLLQYINLKIDSDIEELYHCCLLLGRLASVSAVFSEVHNNVLPLLQVTVSEYYGGTLQFIGSGN